MFAIRQGGCSRIVLSGQICHSVSVPWHGTSKSSYFFPLWQRLTANQLQFWGGKAFPHGNQPVHYAASLYAESEDLINEVITYCKNREEGTRPGELSQYGLYKAQHWERRQKRDFQKQWRKHLELFKTRPKEKKKGSSKRLVSATLALRHDVMQGKEQLFIYYSKKRRRKGQPFLQHSKISVKWITSFMACGVTFHKIFLKCTRSIQNLHAQLVLLSLWRLTNQTWAETPVRIWEFCDSKEKKREREREQDTACQSQRKSQRRPLFKSCQHAAWEETCRRSKNKSRQGNLTFCAFFLPPPTLTKPIWRWS